MMKLVISLIFYSLISSCAYNNIENIEIDPQPTIPVANQKYIVTATGMIFTPANVTINKGDTVEWDNVSGFHNVNGTQTTYPTNPVSFGNSAAAAPWTYTFVFNTIGNYSYLCDVHGIGMSGTITVK